MQGAAQTDIEKLMAPADGKQRQIVVESAAAQRQFPGVAIGPRPTGAGVRLGSVACGVDVGAAGDHQRVDACQCPLGQPDRCRRQQHRQGPHPDHRADVALGNQGRGLLPRPPLGRLDVGAQADHRRGDRAVRCHGGHPIRPSTYARKSGPAPSPSPPRRTPPARRAPCWRSGRRRRRRRPGGRSHSTSTVPRLLVGRSVRGRRRRRSRSPRMVGLSGSSLSTPWRPAAIMAATAR